jgi:hypothetical protein
MAQYRVGESNSALGVPGFLTLIFIRLRLIFFKELLVFGDGFGHCFDHCFCLGEGTKNKKI